MNILICPDKFKGSLDAKGVCSAVASGFAGIKGAQVRSVPLADGGEGTCDLLTAWHSGKSIPIAVHGPLFAPVMAHYGVSQDGKTAFIEMAVASGLTLIRPEQRNPLNTTTLGTGEMIADALGRGAEKIILGIGGSATNDAGIGMATALGYRFRDAGGEILKPTGDNLIHIRSIDTASVTPLLEKVIVTALCDVTNPLYGPDGAAYVYGPQKGASPRDVEMLDAGLQNFRRVVRQYLNQSVDFPGAGAAGGLGAGCKAFLNASMEKGVNYFIKSTQLDEEIKRADLIITGEGKIDSQTLSGKVVSAVLRLAQKEDKPVVALCGKCELAEAELKNHGVRMLISLVNNDTSVESAMEDAATHITRRIRQAHEHIMNL